MLSGELSLDPRVSFAVHEEAYARLLGYPPDVRLEGETRELAEASRTWLEKNGTPRVWVSRREAVRAVAEGLALSRGVTLASRVLAGRFEKEQATRAVAVAVSAGAELDAEVDRLWPSRPEEAYFLDRLGAAVVEHLLGWSRERLSGAVESSDLSVSPSYSPGYRGWDLAEQTKLVSWLSDDGAPSFLRTITLLPSGMLTPRHSLLGVFGIGPRTRSSLRGQELSPPCSICSLRSCVYRRTSPRRVQGSDVISSLRGSS